MSDQEIQILLLGEDGIGKATILSRISSGIDNNAATNSHLPILRDSDQPYAFDVSVKNNSYRLEFFTTKSPTHWTLLNPSLVILCFGIDNRLSLIELKRKWHPLLHKSFPSHTVPVLLLGLRRDLRSETDPNGIIYPQEGYRIAQELRCDGYLECSARSGELVREVWEDICRIAVKSGGANQGTDGGLSEGGCSVM